MHFIRFFSVGLMAIAVKALDLPVLKKSLFGKKETPTAAPSTVYAFPVFDHFESRFSLLDRSRFRPGYLNCTCSATFRGYSKERVMPDGGEKLLALDYLVRWPPTNWKSTRFMG